MNKKLEDKLAMLAFGDLSPEETARLEQEVAGDPKAVMVLREYRDMRNGLKALHDIPEHQLSTERLRHAVLNQGLKPKTRPQLGWLWMPAVAAVFMFGVVFVRNMHQQSPLAGVGSGASFAQSNPTPVAMNEPMGDPFEYATANGDVLSVAATRPAPKVMAASNHVSRHRSDSRLISDLKAQVAMEFDNVYQADIVPQPRVSSVASRSKPERETASSAPSTIVMIGTSKDANTGAQKATEVDSAGDVIVGG
ncbi:MAG TPA: hypothetical protein VHE55_14720 [Fimbriimonadaceae bacterium]|nr:hypothetical protein [Fimbriimonadaceae bacterium]